MKPGFGAKKKNKKRKQKKGNNTDEVMMRDADSVDVAAPEGPVHTAKDKHKQKLERKNALKARVDALKKSRSKVTKLPAGNAARREYANRIKESLQELNAKKEPAQSATAPEDQAAMQE